jgi:hypothetical protein
VGRGLCHQTDSPNSGMSKIKVLYIEVCTPPINRKKSDIIDLICVWFNSR